MSIFSVTVKNDSSHNIPVGFTIKVISESDTTPSSQEIKNSLNYYGLSEIEIGEVDLLDLIVIRSL